MEQVNRETLSTLLWRFSKDIAGKVAECTEKGVLVKSQRLYLKTEVESFSYAKGSINLQSTDHWNEKLEWHWRNQYEFIENVIKKMTSYRDCVDTISKTLGISVPQTEFWLSRYVQVVIGKEANEIVDERLVECITIFVGDLYGSTVEWKVETWLDGIWLEDEHYTLKNGMTLRRPRPSDFELELPFDMMPVYLTQHPLLVFPSCILDFSVRCKEDIEIRMTCEVMLDTLRLFRLGSISSLKGSQYPSSVLKISSSSGGVRYFSSHYKYSFGSDDVDRLQSLFEKLEAPLRSFIESTRSARPIEPHGIAFQRYKDALLQPTAIEGQITSSITCLESLYLRAQEREELAHRLAQRSSALLAMYGFIPFEVYRNIIQAYGIRSTFIHGGAIENEQRRSAHVLCEEVLEYCRISVLVFLQLKERIEKESLIGKLDNSLLDNKARQKLAELLSDNIMITRSILSKEQ